MSNPTDPDHPAESRADAIPGSRPSPVQAAQNAYARHVGRCSQCRDVDRDRCEDGQKLWRAWESACDEAYRQLAEQAP